MLQLQQISLVQFKNYTNRSFKFPERITGICGNNGAGKTNLLDAIYYLCFTRSYFSRLDTGNVKQGQTGFRVEGEFRLQDSADNTVVEKAVCVLRETGRKEFLVNDTAYEKFSRHIGRYPCVMIAPDDAELITGGSEERRKFLDALLAQLSADYLQQLITYTKLLQQRNSLLKSFAGTGEPNEGLLDVLDEQLVRPGDFIFRKRKEFLAAFLPVVKQLYQQIAGKPEEPDLRYESELLSASTAELLKLNRSKDLFAQRTTSGVHRDELLTRLDDRDFKNIASQGQRKSLLFALKLAEMEAIRKEKGFAPLLLLDDVFEKLDESRIGNLLQKVCVENKGQVFITDTHSERLATHLAGYAIPFHLINL